MPGKFDIESARAARDARNRVLGKLGNGRLKPAEVLTDLPDALKGADIYLVLVSCRGLGPEGVRTICERAKVWPHTRMDRLTKRERADIVRELPDRVK